jgi:hypothetical protein
MGRRTRWIVVVAVAGLAVAAAVTATAGAGPTKVRAPRIQHVSGSATGTRASLSATIDPEDLESSYQLSLLYRPPSCCTPKSKECCAPEVEVVATGKLPAGSSAHQIHDSAKLREGSYAVRLLVEADNSAGSSEKSRAIPVSSH